MEIPSNIAKSSVLAAIIFWTIGMTEGFEPEMFAFVFISYIPIFIYCALTIMTTICPFFWLAEKENFSKRQIFQHYYPYYSIISFGLCIYGILSNIDEAFIVGFFVAVFMTTMQSWIWFANEKA